MSEWMSRCDGEWEEDRKRVRAAWKKHRGEKRISTDSTRLGTHALQRSNARVRTSWQDTHLHAERMRRAWCDWICEGDGPLWIRSVSSSIGGVTAIRPIRLMRESISKVIHHQHMCIHILTIRCWCDVFCHCLMLVSCPMSSVSSSMRLIRPVKEAREIEIEIDRDFDCALPLRLKLVTVTVAHPRRNSHRTIIVTN